MARKVQGKELSYNNVSDADAAFELIAEFNPARTAACAIVKHANPCGVAEADNLAEAYELALRCDPVSAFGGIVALNRKLEAKAAALIVKIFTEVIIAPEAEDAAIEIVVAKKNLRLLLTGGLPDPRGASLTFRTVAGGFLAQTRDNANVDDMELRVVSKRAPNEMEWRDLKFAFRVAKHVKSNARQDKVKARDSGGARAARPQIAPFRWQRLASRRCGARGRSVWLAQPHLSRL